MYKNMQEAFIIEAKRTPIGSFGGSLSKYSATQLGGKVVKNITQHLGFDTSLIDEIIIGNVLSAGLGQAPTRQVSYFADLPHNIPATTVNKVCASGMKAVMLAAQSIKAGDTHLVIAGGMESMSNAPYYLNRKNHKLGDLKLIDGLVFDGLTNAYDSSHMGLCAENLNFSRDELDEYAKLSYTRSATAWQEGKFDNEIIAIDDIAEDEEYKRVDFAKFAKLKTIFKDGGGITAANASTINDGASALLIASGDIVDAENITPLAKIISYADYEQEPENFTTSPAGAIQKALNKANLTLDDIDFFEINEAFSSVALANINILNLDIHKVNVNGGAVSLGHPLGSSGSRIIVTLINILKQNNAKYGVASICNGGGGASAVIVENII
jgi:acetyl-CoA C-acetyltransferase